MRLLICVMVLTMAAIAPAALADLRVDFETPFQAIQPAPATKGHISGQAGAPLLENSSGWADVDMHFSRITEGAFEGKAAQRIEVTAVRDGRAQAMIPGVPLQEGKYVRIRFAARAPASGTLEIGLRQQGAPYTSLWTKRFPLSPEWRICEALIPPLPIKAGELYALMIYPGLGITDIDALALLTIDVDALVANAPRKEGNLLSASSFPIGLPSPWSLSSGSIDASAEVDPTARGPSGIASLKLTPGFADHAMPMTSSVEIDSGPIAANQCRPHTISFDARGVKDGQRIWIVFAGPNGPSERRDLPINTEWKRVSATLKLPYVVDEYMLLKVGSNQGFWIDGLQLQEGSTAGALTRSLGDRLQMKATRPFGLSTGSEPMNITYAVLTDVPPGTRIGGNLVDALGHVQPIAPVAITSSNGSAAQLDLPEHHSGSYGTFRAELRLVDPAGKPLSDWAEAVVHHVRPARMLTQDAPDSPFGVHIDPIPGYAQMVKMLGFNWVRIHDAAAYLTKWYFLEDRPDHFDFTRADDGVKLFRDSHLMILGMLDTSPTWRSDCQVKDWFAKYHIPTPQNMTHWEAYCRQVVGRYKNDIHDWEVWNEPYVNDFFRLRDDPKAANGSIPGTPADYVPLLEVANRAAKAVDPACTVLWSDAVGNWSRGCNDHAAWKYCSQASYHNYSSVSPLAFPDFGAEIKSLRNGLPADRQDMVFWNTEGGVGGANDTHILMHTAKPGDPAGALQQAEFLVRYELASQVYGARRFFLYTFHYHGWNPSWDLLLPDGKLPPHASALSAMMWHLEGKRFAQTVPLTEAFSAYVFAGPREDVVVVLAHSPLGELLKVSTLPADGVIRDMFGNDRPLPQLLDRSINYITVPAGKGLAVAHQMVAK